MLWFLSWAINPLWFYALWLWWWFSSSRWWYFLPGMFYNRALRGYSLKASLIWANVEAAVIKAKHPTSESLKPDCLQQRPSPVENWVQVMPFVMKMHLFLCLVSLMLLRGLLGADTEFNYQKPGKMSSAATLTFRDNIKLQNLKIVYVFTLFEYYLILLRLD